MRFSRIVLLALVIGAGAFGQTISTIAGTGQPGFSGDGGPAIHAQFSEPRHLAVDAAGNVYVLDSNNIRIRRITPAGIITTVAGTGEQVESAKGPATRSGLLGVGGLAVMPNGTLYIADATGLQKVDPSGMLSLVVTGQSVGGVALGRSAVYYNGVSDVWLLGPNRTGKVVGGADPGDASDGGPATRAAFFVSHTAVDPEGNIYVADKEAHRIRRFAPRGVITTLAGDGTPGFAGDGGPAAHSQLNRPESIAIDVAGNVYIADTANFRIRRVSTDGVITTFAGGSGQNNRQGDGGPAIDAHIGAPYDVAVGCAGVYITDSESVRKIALTDPLIAYNGVLDAAGKASIAAGQPFSITGCNLAATSANADRNQPLPQTLGRASVTVNGMPATLSSTDPAHIMAVAPAGITAGSVKVVVSVGRMHSAPLSVPAR